MKPKDVSKSLLFCLLIVLAIFKQSFFFGYYALFTDNFIETFCVNKDKPELQCDGKCFLSDLIENNNTESPEIPSYIEKLNVLFFYAWGATSFQDVNASRTLFNYSNNYQSLFSSSSFKPPSTFAILNS